MAKRLIRIVGNSDHDSLIWNGSNQLDDAAELQLVGSDKAGASLNLNGFSDTIARLTLAAGAKVLTSGPHMGGVLTVRELTVDGKGLPKGIYTSSTGWLHGSGCVIVGDVKRLEASGVVDDPNRTIGAGNIAVLKAATTFKLPDGECSVAVTLGDSPLTLAAEGDAAFAGFLTGNGPLRIEASPERPLTITGTPSNAFKGTTTLERGVLKLAKPANAARDSGRFDRGRIGD